MLAPWARNTQIKISTWTYRHIPHRFNIIHRVTQLKKLATYRRNLQTGGTFFFTVNLRNRKSNLLVKRIHELREAIKKVKDKHPFIIHAWVVLPDHMHCIWELPENDHDYATRWRLIKTHFTKSLSLQLTPPQQQGKAGFWQHRFWEHTIRDHLDFERHVNYVHINPMKHGYVKQVTDWPWSSFHVYVEKGIYPQNWAGTNEEFSPSEFGE